MASADARSGGRTGTPARSALRGSTIAIAALWLVVLLGLGGVFAPGRWIMAALAICSAILGAACLIRSGRGGSPDSGGSAAEPAGGAPAGPVGAAILVGALAGFACWLGWLLLSGRGESWLRRPFANLDEALSLIIERMAPLAPAGPLEDLLLLAVLLLAVASVALLIAGKPIFAGAVPAVLLLIPPGITAVSAPWWALACAGALLALLAWLGSPRPSPAGLLVAGLALALAAGAVAAAPPSRDRVWNDQLLLGPLSGTVPDVTVALAEDLRERSSTRAFSYTSGFTGPMRFTLATLADFEGGRWLPQDAPDEAGLTVRTPRHGSALLPVADDPEFVAPIEPTVTIVIEGLMSPWLPMPQGATGVVADTDGDGFDPERWLWRAESNTAYSPERLTRGGDIYRTDTTPVNAGQLAHLLDIGAVEPGGIAFVDDAGRVVPLPLSPESSELHPDAERAPEGLAPYLALPSGLPDDLAAAAAEAAAGAGDRIALGLALQEWFRSGGFAYDESAPYRPGSDPQDPYAVMSALLEQRSGFCVHYASTFAVLARHLGAPTRLAVGYVAQVPRNPGVVRGGDLHAWPEIFVDGLGWVPFEPTPGGAGVRAENFGVEPVSPETQGGDEQPDPETQPSSEPSSAPDRLEGEEAENAAPGTGAEAERALSWAAITVSVLLVLAVLLAPALLRELRAARRASAVRRGKRAARHAWEEFHDTAVDLGQLDRGAPSGAEILGGVAPRAQTPEALVEHLEHRRILVGKAADTAKRLVDAQNAERYRQDSEAAASTPPEMWSEVRALRASLRAAAPRSARIRARLLPRSLRRRVPAPRAGAPSNAFGR